MSSAAQNFEKPSVELADPARSPPRVFTLLEIILAVVIGVSALIVVVQLAGRRQQQQRRERLGLDLQTFATALQDYHRRTESWPPSTQGEVVLPRGLEEVLALTHWTQDSPFGGSYGWIAPSAVGGEAADRLKRGAITLTAFVRGDPLALTWDDLLQIDRQIDDGDLGTGRFRTGFNGWPLYLVED
jgi:type II secretory pathway pseudopilin PulG